MDEITKKILKAKLDNNTSEVQKLQQESDNLRKKKNNSKEKYKFVTSRVTGNVSSRELDDKELRYCNKVDCAAFINPNQQINYLTFYEYKKRKYCDKTCACTQRNRNYKYPEGIREKQSISMYKYYAKIGLYDREKDGSIPYDDYKKYVQKRSQRTLKRNNLISYNIYKDNSWNPRNPYENNLTIEHKIPIRECYDCGISIKEASNINNLEVITMKQNWENINARKKRNS